MSHTIVRSARRALLPPTAKKKLKHLFIKITGITLIVAALILAGSLGSYHHSDPSFNTASNAVTQNLLGPFGAHVTDLLLQTLGIATALIPLLLVFWGWQLITKKGVSVIWARLLIAIAGILLASIFLTIFDQPEEWPLQSGLGGVSGMVIFSFLAKFLSQFNLGFETSIIACASLLMGFAALIFATGFGRSEWLNLWKPLGRSFITTWHGFVFIGKYAGLPNERIEPNFDPKQNANLDNATNGDSSVELKKKTSKNSRSGRSSRKNVVEEINLDVPKGRRATKAEQGCLALTKNENFLLPPLDLLEAPPYAKPPVASDKDSLSQNAHLVLNIQYLW